MATNVQDAQRVNIKFDLGAAVSGRLEAFSRERSQIQAKDEAAFHTAVASNTLSPDAQVSYRQAMLDKAKSQPVPDADYITDLEDKLASAKANAHNSDVLTALNEQKAKTAGGLESNQSYLENLQAMLESENDPSLKRNLQDEITNVEGEILNAKLTLIQSEASKGTTDKSTSELKLALKDAQDQKAQALAVGDAARAASLDVVISGVNQQLVNIKIDTENNGLNINKSTQGNPLGYLGQIQQLIATSDATTPIEYQGVGSYRTIAYASEQEYWKSVLGNYLNTTFIKDLQGQYDNYVANAAVVNKLIPPTVLDSVQSDFAQLSANPVLAPYMDQIQQVGVQVLGKAIAQNAAAIVDDFKTDNDANNAITKLDSLSKKYGIDVSAYTNQVVAGAAKNTNSGISAIQAASVQYQNQGMNPDEALSSAIKDYTTGKLGAPQSNKELATETPQQALQQPQDAAKKEVSQPPITAPIPDNNNPNPAQQKNSSAPTPGISTGMTTPPAQTPPATQPKPQTIDLSNRYGVAQLNGNRTVYDKNQNKALSAADFKAQTGYDINDKNNTYTFDETYKPT